MITFQFEEELQYAKYYADKLENNEAKAILTKLNVSNATEATILAQFFWDMVKASIKDENSGLKLEWDDGAEFWNEKLLQSFSGYLERTGYEQQWEDVTDSI